jgi:hypothetical protein
MQQLITVMEALWPVQLLEKLADLIGKTIAAMRSDGIITPKSSSADIHSALQEKFTWFFEAFANRVGALAAAAVIFNDEVSKGLVETHVI